MIDGLDLKPMSPPEGWTRMFAVFVRGHYLGDVLERRHATKVGALGQRGRDFERRTEAKWYWRKPGKRADTRGWPKASVAAVRLVNYTRMAA